MARIVTGGIPAGRHILQFSRDSHRIAATANDRVRIIDVTSGDEILTLEGHQGLVWDVAYSPDNKMIATASGDKTAKLWRASTGELITTLNGHTDAVMKTVFSSDGTLLATATYLNLFERVSLPVSNDRFETRIWNVQPTLEIRAFQEPMRILDWKASPSGNRVLLADSSSFDAELKASARLWNAGSGDELRDLHTGGHSIIRTLVSPDEARVLSISKENEAYLWDATTGRRLLAFPSKGCCLSKAAAFSADGSSVAVAVQKDDVSGKEAAILVFSTTDGRIVSELTGHESAVARLAFSPNGERLLGITEQSVDLWKVRGNVHTTVLKVEPFDELLADFVDEGKGIITFNAAAGARLWDLDGKVTKRRWSAAAETMRASLEPRSRWLALWDGKDDFRLIDTASAREQKIPIAAGKYVDQAVFSPDGRKIAVCFGDGTIDVRGTDNVAHAVTISSPPLVPVAYAYSPDGARLAIGYQDGRVRIVDVVRGADAVELKGHTRRINSVSFDRQGKRLLTSSDDGSARLWDAATGSQLIALVDHETPIASADFAGNQDRIVTLGSRKPLQIPNSVALVDPDAGQTIAHIVAPELDPAFGSGSVLLESMQFSERNDRLLAEFPDDSLHVFDDQGKQIASFDAGNRVAGSVRLSPSGRLIGWLTQADDQSVQLKVIKVDTGELVQSIPVSEPGSEFVFSPDEHWLVTSVSRFSDHNISQFWSLDTGQSLTDLAKNKIFDVVFAPNGQFVAVRSGESADATPEAGPYEVTVIELAARRTILNYREAAKSSLAFSRDGRFLVVVPGYAPDDRATTLWNLAAGAKVSELKSERILTGRSIEFSPDGSLVATFGGSDYADIFRTADGSRLGTLEGTRESGPFFKYAMNGVEFVDEGKRLLTLTNGNILRLWDIATLKKISEFDEASTKLEDVLGGRRLIVGKNNGSVRIVRLGVSSTELVDLACRLLPTPLTREQRRYWEYLGLEATLDHYPCNQAPQ